MTRKDAAPLVIVVLFGLILQVGLVFLECTNSPSDTAVNYIKAYYSLNPDMSEWLCTDAGESSCAYKSAALENSEVSDHIYNITAEAAEGGFGKSYAKYTLSHIETHTEYLDNTTAVVHLTACRRRAINPLYVTVAKLFGIGETREVEATIRVELNDGLWRVCRSSSLLETS